MTPTFGQAIRTARTNIGYTQRELAALVEIDSCLLIARWKATVQNTRQKSM